MRQPAQISVPPATIDEAAAEASAVLADGGLIVIPTDTVYGIAARLDEESAVEALFAAKLRPRDGAIPALVASVTDAQRLVSGELEAHEGLLRRFWPGALTIVVRRSDTVPDWVTAGRDTVGIRMPDSEIAQAIRAAAGGALAVTSANISGAPAACEVADLPEELLRHVGLVVDGGRCPGGRASTVLDLSAHPPRVLREGPIDADELRRMLPDLVT